MSVPAGTSAEAASSSAGVGAPAPAPPAPPACYVVIASVAKRANVGTITRSAAAFGAAELWVARGPRRALGAQGAERFLPVRDHFAHFRDVVAHARAAGVRLVALEITPDAVPLHAYAFTGPTAFVAGNEGEGIPPAHAALLRAAGADFVYIPQYVGSGTASLNVAVAASIALHAFARWAGYAEAPRDHAGGREKFALPPPPDRRAGAWAEIDEARRAARRAAREPAAAAARAGAPGAPRAPGAGEDAEAEAGVGAGDEDGDDGEADGEGEGEGEEGGDGDDGDVGDEEGREEGGAGEGAEADAPAAARATATAAARAVAAVAEDAPPARGPPATGAGRGGGRGGGAAEASQR